MYQDTVKEKANNIQNVAESSKTSTPCSQIFQCQAHHPAVRPGFTVAKRTFRGIYVQRKEGTVSVTLKGLRRVMKESCAVEQNYGDEEITSC